MIRAFPNFKQLDEMDCGATCLRIIFKYYGYNFPIQKLRKLCQSTNEGVNLLGISKAAEAGGFRSFGGRLTIEQLKSIELPCIIHWKQSHFVVLYKIKNEIFFISDPAIGLTKIIEQNFIHNWYPSTAHLQGLALILSPRPDIAQIVGTQIKEKSNWTKVLLYFSRYKKLFVQLILGILFVSLLQLVGPFLTQSIVDLGIKPKDIGFINLILAAQLMVFVGSTSVSFIRSWVLLHLSTRLNISILTDLLTKIMKLPMNFFDLKTHGDIMQRITDQQRIETFLTGNTLNTIFSLFSMILFGFILIFYDTLIFFIFLLSTILYILWVLFFMKYRRELDQSRFNISSENQTYLVEMIQSIKDIKLNNAQLQKRWGWEELQATLFKYKIKSLSLSQYQSLGALAINQIKNILIIYFSALAVINGELTLGAMMAIQYIIGMTNSPLESLIGFFQSYQDAKISLERLNEVFDHEEEQSINKDYLLELPLVNTIEIRNLTFRYLGAGTEPIFTNLSLQFPEGKTIAIVGASGSGKTTIIKLLLRYYEYEMGEILVGGKNLDKISFETWRANCGVVLQDSYVYADTIERNIAVGIESPDPIKIQQAIQISNLNDFIEEQPFGLNTKIGIAGKGLSQGQKQRLMIARAVYKDPKFIFLDEATNALDANNERTIIENLNSFFKNRTVIVVAHRLSTVKNADNIIVLERGQVVEQGNHLELTSKKGKYYELVKNQLELGN